MIVKLVFSIYCESSHYAQLVIGETTRCAPTYAQLPTGCLNGTVYCPTGVHHCRHNYQGLPADCWFLTLCRFLDATRHLVCSSCLGPVHLLAAKGVLRYLAGTRDWGLNYGGGVRTDTVGYSDADWATDQTDRHSISGYAFFMFSGLVSWSSSKQKATALSSTEAEYMAITHAAKEALWICLFC